MRKEQFFFTGHQNTRLNAILWLPENTPKAILQVTHGMTEHIGRYEALAETLTGQGLAVAGFDLRGHGGNAGDQAVASFGQGGWEASLEDMRLFFQFLEQRFAGIPHFLQGFSLGSYLLREYLGKYPDNIAGAIILGTGNQPVWLLKIMASIALSQTKKVGFDGYSPLVRQLSFGVYNRNFKPNRTEKDWLCSDSAQVDAFIADPLCRGNFSAGLFFQMLQAMARTGGKDACTNWCSDLPVLLLSGEQDPVGNFTKGTKSVYGILKERLRDVTLRFYPGARHDLLHEIDSGTAAQVRAEISGWILSRLGE